MNGIDQYLAALPLEQRKALQQLRGQILAAAPGAEEILSYKLPAFRLNGRILVFFGATPRHCAFYVGCGTTVAEHKAELAGFSTSTGTIRFQPDAPIPAALVRKLVKARIAQDAAKKTKATQRVGARSGRKGAKS